MGSQSYDRSWNDPPTLSFSKSKQCSSKRTLLNKRVPFPSDLTADCTKTASSDTSRENDQIGNINADLNEVPPAYVPTLSDSQDGKFSVGPAVLASGDNTKLSDADILSYVMKIFTSILYEVPDKDEMTLKSINHRIKIMKDLWNEKLSENVKHLMHNLASELSDGNHDAADKIHCSLMVDHCREVRQWMVGVKHIIQLSRMKDDSKKSQNCAVIDNICTSSSTID